MRAGVAEPRPPVAGRGTGAQWPTPRASDGDIRNRGDLIARVKERPMRHSSGMEERREGRENERVPGHLNPVWVEWLMGFPAGWTDLSAPPDLDPKILKARSGLLRGFQVRAAAPVVGRLPSGDLLPTPSAVRYGSSNNGDPRDGRGQYRQRGKLSLWSRAERGLLPGHPAGPLAAEYVEWLMGFPARWTDLSSDP